MSRRGCVTAAAAFVVSAAIAFGLDVTPAAAQDRSLTRAEVVDLILEARTDPGALDDLEQVTQVDGEPVDFEAALSDVPASLRRARLQQLAAEFGTGAPSTGAVDASKARDDARDVVTGRDYRKRELPAPLRGPLRWLADRFRPVLRALARPFKALWTAAGTVAGGQFVLLLLVVVPLVLAVAWIVSRRSGAKVRFGDPARYLLVDPDADPDDLRRRADEAEAAGDLELAIRMLFAEGVLRLARAGRLDLRPDTTASRVAAAVGGDTVLALVRSFEEIVYGGRAPTASDVTAARAGWGELLAVKAAR